MEFNELEIQSLFGHEAAEDESIDRLREYYFKSSTYDNVCTDLSLRILVGHKGIGKSALFQVAMAEDQDKGNITVSIKPDDIVGLTVDDNDFLKTIRDWKNGFIEIIAQKILSTIGYNKDGWQKVLYGYSGKLVDFLIHTFKDIKPIDFSASKQAVITQLLKTGKINVYIDDLDRGWQGRKSDVNRISALLNAIRDISRENKGVNFRVSLRSDVYFLVRTSDESTDKIEGSVIWHTWTNHEIFALLIKRIETFFGRQVYESELLQKKQVQLATYLNPIMEPKFNGYGHWKNAPIYRVLMSLIRKRPRDLVKLCTLAARDASSNGLDKIYTKSFENIFEQYSQGRLQDTVNEFRSELPEIERLLISMKPSKKERTARQGYVYNTAGLLAKIKNIQSMGQFKNANSTIASDKQLAAFLYKINFLTARKEIPGRIERRYYEENRYLSGSFADFGYDWEIHPAYRWALQPDDIKEIYNQLLLEG